MNIYVVCPIRNATPRQIDAVREHVMRMEKEGHRVHWPYRNTVQEDETNGFRVCLENRSAIERANLVAVYWDPASAGSLFDLGIAWALRKPIMLLNYFDVPDGRVFERVLLRWEAMGCDHGP